MSCIPVGGFGEILVILFLCEIEAERDEFHKAHLIGCVRGKYQLVIGDVWVAGRIEKMIGEGKLAVISVS